MKEKDIFDLDLKISPASKVISERGGLTISWHPNWCPDPPLPSTKETNCSFIPPCPIRP